MRFLILFFGFLSFPVVADDFSREALIDADYKQGRLAFQQRCSACHTLGEGSHLVGPNLGGVFGDKPGQKEGFNYSDAMRSAEFEWTPESVGEFIAEPAALVPGTNMMIPEGVPAADRVAMVAFIMLETGAADWERPVIEDEALPEDASYAERYPSFWNHMMTNT